jgi:hypothetical protein
LPGRANGEGDRFTGPGKPDRVVIEVRVLDIDEQDAEAVMHAENPHRG